MFEIAVDLQIGNTAAQIRIEPVTELAHTLRLFSHFRAGQFGSAAEPDTKRCRKSARTQPALLSAAIDQRQKTHARPAADVERADALWPVELVAGNGHQIDARRLDIERDFPGRLRRVG